MLRIASRGSRLALAQVEIVKKLIPDAEAVIVKTSGDQGDRDKVGAFVREVEWAVLRGEADAALHCLKDLPTDCVEGLEFGAYLKREDPRDALIRVKGIDTTIQTIGTGSLRRTAQLRREFPEATYLPLVGNVDSRLKRLESGEFDALVLAMAGLHRLNCELDYDVRPFTTHEMIPAAGQGTLVLQTRITDTDQISRFDHQPTRFESLIERSFLKAFGTGCSLPIGVYANWESRTLSAGVFQKTGREERVKTVQFDSLEDGTKQAETLATEWIQDGVLEWMER